MSTTTPEPLGQYHGREADLTQELIAYFRLAAASLGDPDQLEALLDDLCAADDAQITSPQAAARVRQVQYVRNLLRERTRVEALEEVYGEAMQAAQAVGGQYYAHAAARLTRLQAEALGVLEQQNPDEFPRILAQMEGIAEHARRGNQTGQV
jgi:ribosomal 50S subunit-associated protein YjgA (DUF615 family)